MKMMKKNKAEIPNCSLGLKRTRLERSFHRQRGQGSRPPEIEAAVEKQSVHVYSILSHQICGSLKYFVNRELNSQHRGAGS